MHLQLNVRRMRALVGLRRPPLFAALFACTAAFPAVPIRGDSHMRAMLPGLGGGAWRGPQRLRGGWGALSEDVMKRERLGEYSMYTASAKGAGAGGKEPGLNAVQAMLLECGFAFGATKDERGRFPEGLLDSAAELLRKLSPEDLGQPEPYDGGANVGGIEYTDVYVGGEFTMCMFKLPAGARLPMHDHPHMTVLSKVLWGEMSVHAYDRTLPPQEKTSGGGFMGALATQMRGGPDLSPFEVSAKAPAVWTAKDGVQVTLPDDGNIHEFRAVTPCCFVDVLAPPYDSSGGRRCTYYEIDTKPEGTLLGRPVQCPSDYTTTNTPYQGLPAELENM